MQQKYYMANTTLQPQSAYYTNDRKSTQVPQFLLDDPQIGPTCNILVTQPRRISAISVAERVASERCQAVGQSVGYSVRLESSHSKKTQLLFVTPGVLMKRLNPYDSSSPFGDSNNGIFDGGGPDTNNAYGENNGNTIKRLAEFTHIIMDEIHERDKNTEFLMIALQDLLEERDDLQIILMSATMPTRELAEYWHGVGRKRLQRQKELTDGQSAMEGNGENDTSDWVNDESAMPVEINIPGRTFPVQEFFLEDVLAMTRFVNDVHGDAPDMDQIESDLMALLSGPTPAASKTSKNGKPNAVSSSLLQLENSLTCVMCNKSGFQCPEEFGTHVALCDG